MRISNAARIMLATVPVIVAGGSARADYYSQPKLRPSYRCSEIPPGIGCDVDNNPKLPDGTDNPNFRHCLPGTSDPGGPTSMHCQRLFWDLQVSTQEGAIEIGAPFAEDPIPRFPNGVTDRIPPMWVGTLKVNVPDLGKSIGDAEGFESETDCTTNANSCHRLCTDALDIPYWQELNDNNGNPDIGIDTTRHGVDKNTGQPNGQPLTGQKFKLQCRRGSRSYYGPWQTGGTVNPTACQNQAGSDTNAVAGVCQGPVFDRLAAGQPIRFENTDRLDWDVANAGTPADKRLEWAMGSEYYNHFSSHHGTCYQPTDPCTDVNNPPPKEAYSETDQSATCYKYEKASAPGGRCYAGDDDPRCQSDPYPPDGPAGDYKVPMGGFRNATQLPGRLSVPLPDGRGVLAGEDIVWGCNHHVVTQLPPGSYSMSRIANYRLQTHGIVNSTQDTIFGTAPGAEYGGAVGEMIIQYFASPLKAAVKPANANFNALADAATTYYPPFTWQYHESEWEPPFDSEVAIMAIHSHHRMVKGTMNIAPVNPPRPNATDPTCGGPKPDGTPATDLYTDWFWEDAPVCQFWKQKDGPVPIRKGESLRTTCYVNNGITPEAIKHGLVAGATVETLKNLGAPIPDYPKLVPASTWGDALEKSYAGQELLYGTHPPINYRVVYKCSTSPQLAQVPGATMAVLPEGIGNLYNICTPNPAIDKDGDYIDGAYRNDIQCGNNDGVADQKDGLCEPSSIVFACIGEDEMCIGVALYWAMPRLLNPDTNAEAMQNLQNGDVNNVGLPGSTGQPTDYPAGNCVECKGPGL